MQISTDVILLNFYISFINFIIIIQLNLFLSLAIVNYFFINFIFLNNFNIK